MMHCNKVKSNQLYALHGFLGTSADWSLFPEITHRFDVQHEELDFWEWGERFNRETAKQFKKGKNILLGYSLGGRLAMHALLQAPALWDAVILVSAHPGLLVQEEREERLKTDQQWAERFLNEPWNDLLKDWNRNQVFGGLPPRLIRKEEAFSRDTLAKQLIHWSLGRQEYLLEDLKRLSTPIFVIAGELDARFSKIAEQSQSFAKVSIVSEAAHRVPWDQPEIFSDQITQFIKELE